MPVTARSGAFEVSYRRVDGGAVLDLAGESGRFELRSDEGAVWRAHLRDEHGAGTELDGRDADFEAAVERPDDGGAAVELTWRDEPVDLHAGSGTATTRLVGRVRAGDPTVRWSAAVEVEGVAAAVRSFTLPAVDDVRRGDGDRGDDRLVVPDGWGLSVPDPLDNPERATMDAAEYPGKRCSMQFLGLTNAGAGLYVAAHDPRGRPKTLSTRPDGDGGDLALAVTHHPAAVTSPTDEFELPYVVATGTFAGGWYDAALRYRRWVEDAAEWTRSEGPEPPEWLRRRCLWWLLAPRRTDHERDRELLARLREAFPVPAGVHWYTWHRGPFDVDYPDYFPSRPGFEEAVAAVETDDVRVMPYLNGRLADPNSEAWGERDLAAAAARDASARVAPSHRPPCYETYDGQSMVAMCPATARWRDTVADAAGRLAEETAASAVYLDQLGAHAPPRCHAEGHDHPDGGGAHGVAGYRELLSAVRERAPGLAVATENNAEPYVDLVDATLMWNSARSDLVPLFDAVYGDRTLAFGRQYFPADLDHDGAFRSKVAQSLSFGAQPGWIRHGVAERLLEPGAARERRYLRDAVGTLDDAGGVPAGRRLRDPDVEGVPARTVRWELHRHGSWDVTLPAVCAGLWRGDGGVATLLLTNWTATTHEARVALPTGQVPPDAVRGVCVRGTVDSLATAVDEGDPLDDEGAFAVTLPDCTTAVLELEGGGG